MAALTILQKTRGAPSAAWSLVSLELPQVIVARRKQDGGRALAVGKSIVVALHGPIEIVECRVLAEACSIGFRRVRLGLSADDLRLLRTLRTDCGGLLIACGLH